MAAHLATEEHHPSAKLYCIVAAFLFIFTMIEVIVYYVPSLRVLELLAPILLVLSAIKFATVGGYYMHLKMDHKLFMVFFASGLALAAMVIIALMTLFGELTTPGKPIHSISTAPFLQTAQQTPLQSPATTAPVAAGVTAPRIDPNSIGNVELGKEFWLTKGCTGCHMAPGIPGGGQIGPNQAHFYARPTIAGGVLPNTPESVELWLHNPPAVKPGTLMPNLGLSPQEIRDLTAFLYSLP